MLYKHYIYDNLIKIEKPNNVNIIKPVSVSKSGRIMCATINNGETIPLITPKSVITFPFEPIYWLAREHFGTPYFKNFTTFANQISINKNHLLRLGYVDNNEKRIYTYAYFDDGQIIGLYKPLRNQFFKHLKPEMEQVFDMRFEDVTEEMKQQNELNQ